MAFHLLVQYHHELTEWFFFKNDAFLCAVISRIDSKAHNLSCHTSQNILLQCPPAQWNRIIHIDISCLYSKTSPLRCASMVRKDSIVLSGFTREAISTCKESSSTASRRTLFTWKTQWKQKTQSFCVPTSQVSVDGEIFKVMTRMGQMFPILFIWKRFRIVAVLTWAHIQHAAVYLSDPSAVRLLSVQTVLENVNQSLV